MTKAPWLYRFLGSPETRLRMKVKYRAFLYGLRYPSSSVVIDPSSWISPRARLKRTGGGTITIGADCEIHENAILDAFGGSIAVGDGCSVNPFTVIYGMGDVRVQSGSRIATHVVIVSSNHAYDTALPIRLAGSRHGRITIESNVWIGAGARILAGVTIGRNSVIGAGAVVTKPVPEECLALGVPAVSRPIFRS